MTLCIELHGTDLWILKFINTIKNLTNGKKLMDKNIKGISILGTYWDDAGYIQTTPIIYDKIRIFFTQYSNPYLGHFNYNLEFYGYLFPIIVDIFSNFELIQLHH